MVLEESLASNGHIDGLSESDDAEKMINIDDLEAKKHIAIVVSDNDGQQSNLVDWSGPDDPEKAVNWPTRKKLTNLLLISTLTLLTPFDSSMFAPAIKQVMQEFDSSNETMASFIVSIYLLGYAFGPLFLAPLSELYGKLPIYHTTTILFIVFNIGCAEAKSIASLTVLRFLTGVAGSCPLTVGSGSIADMYRQEHRGTMMSVWMLPVMLGPTLGPLVGGYVSQSLGWRWNFWLMAIVTGAAFIATIICLRETYPPILLKKKVHRLQKMTKNPSLRAISQSQRSPTELFWISIVRPTKLLFLSPIVFSLSLYVSVLYGYLYLIFTTIPDVFQGQYGISASNVGLVYLGIGAGNIGGLILIGYTSDKLVKRMTKNGEMKPEYRLPPLAVAVLFMPIGLFWYGWSIEANAHWIVPIIGSVFMGLGMICTSIAIGTYLVDAFDIYAASATAANTVLRSVGGALLPLCGRQLFQTLGYGWGNSLLGFLGLAMIPVVFLLLKYGESMRKNSTLRLGD